VVNGGDGGDGADGGPGGDSGVAPEGAPEGAA
jgi:hypothetical protein